MPLKHRTNRGSKDEFRVPPATGFFADLGDQPDSDMEWGVPEPVRLNKDGSYVYQETDAANVLTLIYEVAGGLAMGSDCIRQARAILAWVREQRKKRGIQC